METLAAKNEKYFAVIYEETVHIPAQGHGYPAYTSTQTKYEEIGDMNALENWIKDNHNKPYPKKNYRVLRCEPVDVEVTVKVIPVVNYRDVGGR